MLELAVLQNFISALPKTINDGRYDKKAIMKRYFTLKREFLQPYEKDSSQ
jgi:hypothetical protein